MIRIRLVDGVEGYLDIKEGSNFPINMGISEIRDISKRSGLFSKTITLVGNKNNNRLLGSLYDVNIVAGTYNINKLQKCQVIDGGEVILDNLYFQLIGVTKISNNINDEQFVEYGAVIKDTVSDFFTKIGQRELSDIDFSDFDYTPAGVRRLLTKSEVTSSFDNTILDGFKFVLPWLDPNRKTAASSNPSNTYQLREINPAIYAKIYFDRIFSGAGYRYTWNDLTDLDIRFDKLLIPYNGDEKQILSGVQEQYEVNLESSGNAVITFKESDMTEEAGVRRIYNSTVDFNTEIKDLENQWDTGTQTFTSGIAYTNASNGLNGELVCDYKLELINNESVNIKTRSNVAQSQNGIVLFPTWKMYKYNGVTPPTPYTNVNQYADGLDVQTVIPYATEYSPGTTILKEDTISLSQLINYYRITGTLTDFKVGLGLRSDRENFSLFTPGWVRTTDNGTANYRYKITISNLRLNFKPALGAIDYRIPIVMNGYVPKKVKQVDFIKSIAQLYNLYFEPDKYDKGNIIIKTRDDYYDSGEILDWTNKQVKDKETNIQFLPELTSKSLILSYKEDKDYANTVYKDATSEVYGELKWTFDNEYVKGENRKELIFSPTPVSLTSFGAVMPVLNGFNPNNNIRILLDNGSEGRNYYIEEDGSTVSSNIVPIISHFGGNQLQPDFDINYGLCSYYFYQFVKTNNNLGNLHWRRTLNQINSGKLLTTLFNLNTSDVRTLRLNSKIRINNSYWNINKVIDFDANSKAPTKVELISIDVNTDLGNFFDRDVSEPVNGEGIVNINSNWQIESRNGFSNNVNVIGYNNSIEPTTTGYITGDNNIFIAQSNSPIIVSGDNNIVKADAVTIFGYNNDVESGSTFITGASNSVAPGLNGVTILGSNITATTSNTTYTENIIMTPGSTLNGVPVNNITEAAIQDILYTDLYNLWVGNLLVPGQVYRITDFQTIYDQPDYDITGSPKTPVTLFGAVNPILVRANGIGSLEDQVWGYVDAVVMRYDISFNQTEVNGTPAKGRITYILDINGNESYFDHLNIILKRYETINGSGLYDNWRDTGFASDTFLAISFSGNKIGPTPDITPFITPNIFLDGAGNILDMNCNNISIVGDGNNLGFGCVDNLIRSDYNTLGDNSVNNIINGTSDYNKIGSNTSDNNITGNYNKIGCGSTGITINGTGNILGESCTTNGITGDNNEIGDASNNNDITGDYNKIGDASNSNTIFYGNNIISDGCSGNNIDGSNNILYWDCQNNNIVADGNILGFSCDDNIINGGYNTFGNTCEDNQILSGSTNNTFGNWCKDNILTSSGYNIFSNNNRNNNFTNVNNASFVSDNITNLVLNTGYNNFSFDGDKYNTTILTRTTTNAVPQNMFFINPFTASGNGYYAFECVVTGNEPATGDTIIVKGFAGFKVIGGVVTQVSTATIDRKSDFPAGVNITINTNGTLIILSVTGRTGSTINWRGNVTITK